MHTQLTRGSVSFLMLKWCIHIIFGNRYEPYGTSSDRTDICHSLSQVVTWPFARAKSKRTKRPKDQKIAQPQRKQRQRKGRAKRTERAVNAVRPTAHVSHVSHASHASRLCGPARCLQPSAGSACRSLRWLDAPSLGAYAQCGAWALPPLTAGLRSNRAIRARRSVGSGCGGRPPRDSQCITFQSARHETASSQVGDGWLHCSLT